METTKIAHTPGPWIAREQLTRSGESLGWIVETENGSRIGWSNYADALTNEGDRAPYIQSGANAQVLAAAPDLLAACRKALDELDFECSPTAEVLKAAIAKAEGR